MIISGTSPQLEISDDGNYFMIFYEGKLDLYQTDTGNLLNNWIYSYSAIKHAKVCSGKIYYFVYLNNNRKIIKVYDAGSYNFLGAL